MIYDVIQAACLGILAWFCWSLNKEIVDMKLVLGYTLSVLANLEIEYVDDEEEEGTMH